MLSSDCVTLFEAESPRKKSVSPDWLLGQAVAGGLMEEEEEVGIFILIRYEFSVRSAR